MDIAVALTSIAIAMLALAVGVGLIRWLRREPDKRDLGLGDLLIKEQSLDLLLDELQANARKSAWRYVAASGGITILLEVGSILVLLVQRTSPDSHLLLMNGVFWLGFGGAICGILLAQLLIGYHKAKRVLITQRSNA